MKRRGFNLVMSIMLIATALSACSGGGGGTSGGGVGSITLSGTIASGGTGTGYTVAMSKKQIFYAKALSFIGFPSPAFAVSSEPTVNKIVAIPMDRGSLTSRNMPNSITQTIDAGTGAFSLTLGKDTDWLLMLIDSTATGTSSRFVGSVGVNTGSSDSLLNLPVTDSVVGSIDLGAISRATLSTNDAISAGTVTAANFNMTVDQLTAMAKTDDIFKNAMNIVNNYGNTGFGNGATDWYTLRPDFSWSDSSKTLDSAYSHPSNLVYDGMNFQLDTNTMGVNMMSLCTNTGYVALYPPAPIVLSSVTYSIDSPIKNNASCSPVNSAQETNGGNLYATDAYAGKMSYSVLGSITGTIPPGRWVWKENGTAKAAFEVGGVNPPVGISSNPTGFVPSFKLNIDAGTKQILSIGVQWYYYDGANYVPVTDKSVLKHFLQTAEVKFDVGMGGGSRKTCEMNFDPSTTSTVVPSTYAGTTNCSLTWYYGSTDVAHTETNTGLMGFYESGGFGYFFHYPIKP